ncbi:MAG: DUF1598 domain-containing protein [Planctomycetota bacterium]
MLSAFSRSCLPLAAGLLALAVTNTGSHKAHGQATTPPTVGTGLTSGVAVDASGVLQRLALPDPTGQLARERAQNALAMLDADISRQSRLRKVSLTRLSRLIDRSIEEGHGPDDAMQHLAGLTRIRYVFFYPETGDIVLAGPAEGWMPTATGRMVGLYTGQPVIELQDLAVALRAFPASKQSDPFVYCSIDPTQEGLSRMQQFLSRIGRQIGPNDTQFIVQGLQESLGLQTVSVGGIPATTHFAQVLVEADYRMKLIGIGLEQPPVRMASFVALANPATVARNALQRWYFVPDYQRIKLTENADALEFVGNGVKLVGEDEVVGRDGGRSASKNGQSRASRKFTRTFTQKYNQIADRAPVYGQLRNCVDLLVAAAFLQHYDLYTLAGWEPQALLDESAYAVETLNAPREVATAVNSMWKGNRLMTPVGGGVQIQAGQALDSENVAEDDGEVAKAHAAAAIADLPADQWWWD